MDTCTSGIRAVPRKEKQRSAKCFQTTSLCYSNAKSTLKVPLTLNKVEKTELENFDFVHLLSFFFFLSQGQLEKYTVFEHLKHTESLPS